MGLKTGRLKHEKRTNGEVVLNPLQPIWRGWLIYGLQATSMLKYHGNYNA
jgi:hypothetical protein